jgi:oxidoreductase
LTKCQVPTVPLHFSKYTHSKNFPLALSPRSALIFGATGQTGRYLLQSLLASPHFTRVGEYGRKVTSPSDIKTGKDKLEQKVIDFEKIQEYGLKQGKWDVVFITYVLRRECVTAVLTCCSFSNYSLGTTKSNAGSAEAFEKIDRESVLQVIERIFFH